jgi:8-oxo-dGTP pyrophosphatase MutT (NUDIX family)
MGRVEYLNDPAAPRPNSLVPAAGVLAVDVLAVDERGRMLLQRRRDTGQWAIPMGKQELGETVAQCAIRETLEETGVTVEVTGLLPPGLRRAHSQRRGVGGRVVHPGELQQLDIHPTQRRQLRDWLDGTAPHFD